MTETIYRILICKFSLTEYAHCDPEGASELDGPDGEPIYSPIFRGTVQDSDGEFFPDMRSCLKSVVTDRWGPAGDMHTDKTDGREYIVVAEVTYYPDRY